MLLDLLFFMEKNSSATYVSSVRRFNHSGTKLMGKTQLYWRVLNTGLEVPETGMQRALCCW
jgi:hypothetical protein